MALLASPTAGGAGGARRTRRGLQHRRLRHGVPGRRAGRARGAPHPVAARDGDPGEPVVRGHRASSPTPSRRPTTPSSGSPRRGRSTRRRRRSSRRSWRARCCRTPTSATRGPTGCPTAARASSSASTTRRRSSRSRPAMSRLEAESGPQGHAITRWLGRDAPDLAPRVGEITIDADGWVLVCSDGLWNYASEPDALVAQITAAGDQRARGAGRGADRVRERAGRPGQHHRRPGADCRAECRSTRRAGGSQRAEPNRSGGVRWLSSPPPSTRTSSFPTAGPTSTRS